MTEILFYRLSARPLEAALPDLLSRTLARGWRAVVKAGDAERMAALDAHLWTFDAASFLAHGAAPDPHAARQPIWLTTGDDAPNGADVLFLVGGAEAGVDTLASYARACVMFDAADEAGLALARAQWKRVVDARKPAVYWSQTDDGRWEKAAESKPEVPIS